MVESKIYILSTGRCGTNFLHRFFEKYYPENKISHQTRGSRIINIIGNLPLPGRLKLRMLQRAFYIFKRDKIPGSTLDPMMSFSLTKVLIKKHYDNVRIVHLVRDPSRFAQSFIRWEFSTFKRFILHHFIPFWKPNPIYHGIGFVEWIRMTKFEKYCWIWYYKNKEFSSLSKHFPYKLVRFEDLTGSNMDSIIWNDLLQFLGLDIRDIDYRSFASSPVNISPKSSPFFAKRMKQKEGKISYKYCSKLAACYGYL